MHVEPPIDVSLDDCLAVLPNNPLPPLDRRWRVIKLAERGFKLWTGDHQDTWIQKGTTYLKALLAAGTDADRVQLAAELPDLDTAYKISSGDKLTRGILEARVLAGLPLEQVAAACGLTAECVSAYEALFFDVRDGLAFPDYVMITAIGLKLHYGLTAEDVDIILKHIGYFGGSVLLDWLISFYKLGLIVPDSLQSASKEQLQTIISTLSAKALHVAYVLPVLDCFRALRLKALTDELQTYVDSLNTFNDEGTDNCSIRSPLEVDGDVPHEVLASAEKAKAPMHSAEWWSSWRDALQAA